jgi:hypothetical protein
VYVSFGGYSTGNLWRTRDGGTSWSNIHGNLPAAPVRALALHPNDSRWLYVGTEVGLFAAEDARDAMLPSWGLPGSDSPANVSVDQVFFLGTRLVAATYGRGLFTNDGIIPTVVSNPYPPDGSTSPDVSVNLSWAAATAATSYEVYFGTTSTLTSAQRVAIVSELTHPVNSLVTGTRYYWRVDASGPFGATTGTVWSFTAGPATFVSEDSDKGKICFIATAAFGTPMAAEVRYLRAFRDRYLLTNAPGRWFVENYYRYSPPLADVIRSHPALGAVVRWVLMPFVAMSRFLVGEEAVPARTAELS